MIENVEMDLSFSWTSYQHKSKPTHEMGHQRLLRTYRKIHQIPHADISLATPSGRSGPWRYGSYKHTHIPGHLTPQEAGIIDPQGI